MVSLLVCFLFFMVRRPTRSTRTDTLFPYTTLFRSGGCSQAHQGSGERVDNVEQPAKGVVAMYRVEIIIKGTADEMALAVRIAKATLHRDRKSTRLNSSH